MSTIGDYIKQERKKAGGTGEGNCENGQSESGPENVWYGSSSRKD